MNGAREYAKLFKTGLYGKLYFVSSQHSRGYTFRIFILPIRADPMPNGNNAPLNPKAVEVYGVISGNPGWTESYGWIHHGPWEADFENIVSARRKELAEIKIKNEQISTENKQENNERIAKLLSAY